MWHKTQSGVAEHPYPRERHPNAPLPPHGRQPHQPTASAVAPPNDPTHISRAHFVAHVDGIKRNRRGIDGPVTV